MKTSARNAFWLTAVLLVVTSAQAGEWRTYSGGFSTRWKTVGEHGHDQPVCADARWIPLPQGMLIQGPNCDAADFARGNLDNNIGFRAGGERDFLALGALRLVGGAEGSINYTEYNLTQNDFALVSGAVLAGADLAIAGLRLGGRYGGGPFLTSDGQARGITAFREVSLTLPLRGGAAVRISSRHTKARSVQTAVGLYGAGPLEDVPVQHYPGSPSSVETSVLLVTSPSLTGKSQWEFATATGTTRPGLGLGGSRSLRKAAFTRMSVFRDLPWRELQLEIGWLTSAEESLRPTEFRGYYGNFRSKTIDGFGAGVSRSIKASERVTVRYGGGLEVADWRDEHELLTRDGKELRGGIETAATATVALRYQLAPHVAFESSLQKVYWPEIDLSEARVAFGIVLTR